ncbi:MAG: matrixin family metalloprotease, partial [Actinomycetota bacterium]
EAEPRFGPGLTHGYVLLHELGHALNLGHVEDPREVMCPGEFAINPLDLGRGDRSGLQTLTS